MDDTTTYAPPDPTTTPAGPADAVPESGMDKLRRLLAADPNADNETLAERSGLALKSVRVYKGRLRREGAHAGVRPPGRRPDRGSRPRTRTTTRPANKTPAPGRSGPYAEGITGLLTMAAGALGILARTRASIPLTADAVTIQQHAPALGDGVQILAVQYPNITPWLDKIMSAGPFSALLAPLATMGAQMAVNHNRMPAGTMGTMDPSDLVAIAVAEATGGNTAPPADAPSTPPGAGVPMG